MEVKVRCLEPFAVKKIDELASRSNLSRNAFLKTYLERLAVMDKVAEIESQYEQLAKSLSAIIAENTVAFEKVLQYLEREDSNG